MSIHEQIKEAERRNMLFMEDLEQNITCKRSQVLILSCTLWENIIRHPGILYQSEAYDFTILLSKNADIIAQLANGDINAQEACRCSNAIYIEAINKLRSPGEVKINTASFRNNDFSELKNNL